MPICSYKIADHAQEIEDRWLEKLAISSEILQSSPHRSLQPEALGTRTRLDLMWNVDQLGIRGPSERAGDFAFFNINSSDSIPEKLNQALQFFCASIVPKKQLQLRFRYSTQQNLLGLWVDCDKQSIEEILASNWPEQLLEKFDVVEFGQKNFYTNATPGISNTHCWLSSYNAHNVEIPLKCHVSSFSQPGEEANRALIACGLDLIESCLDNIETWAEIGAGYGNLSAAFSTYIDRDGMAVESDAALHQLLTANVLSCNLGFQPIKSTAAAFMENLNAKIDLLIIDPPRCGFFEQAPLTSTIYLPNYILCYHCHHQGLLNDTTALKKASYELVKWSAVDCFPGSQHLENISLWKMKQFVPCSI